MTNITYTIEGSDMQYVEVILPAYASIVGEQGAMMYMDDTIQVTAVLGDGSPSRYGALGRFFKAFKRSLTGESLFSSRYFNSGLKPQRVAFAGSSISKIVAIDLDEVGGELICQKGAYLAGQEGIEIKLAFQKRLRVGFFGGEGFIMQRITGKGLVFINASGALKEMVLAPAQNLQVDSGCLVALSPTVTYEIKYAGKIKTALFGGEGLFYANLVGPGKVWMQSLPERRLSIELMKMATLGSTKGITGKVYLLVVIAIAIISFLAEIKK
ncbi:TIGR00266 family protein [Methylosoma difficile]